VSFLENIDVPERRVDRKTCAYCEASAAGCRSVAWLRGRNCCEACDGNHDQEPES
jgi:hypothetical protein